MNLSFIEELDVKGHLTISKLHNDGREEVVFDDHNIIVSGMGVALSHLFALSGSTSVLDYQIDRFQIGVSGATALETYSRTSLSGPLTSIVEYGSDGNVVATSGYQLINNAVVANQTWYGLIPDQNVTRIDDTTVRYTILLDENSCNAENIIRNSNQMSINEIGLFIRNVKNNDPTAPILVAYRHFDEIKKTTDFSIIFRWSINF